MQGILRFSRDLARSLGHFIHARGFPHQSARLSLLERWSDRGSAFNCTLTESALNRIHCQDSYSERFVAMSLKLATTNAVEEVPLQFELFETHSRALSQTVALWDVAPRGVYSDKAEDDSRILERAFEYGGQPFQLALSPAILKKDGVQVSRYPGDREQLVEEVIRYLAARRNRLKEGDNGDLGISFSLYEVYKELERTGHQLKYGEIREALTVLHKAHIEIVKVDGEGPRAKERVVSGSTFPMLVLGDRNSDVSECRVSFNWLVSQAVRNLDFRQIDYEMLMKMPGPIARWLYRHFVHESLFFGRSPVRRVIRASEIVEGCGMTVRSRPRDTFRRIAAALAPLSETGLIESMEAEDVIQGKSRVDVEYTIVLTEDFAKSLERSRQVANQSREDFRVISGGEPTDLVRPRAEDKKKLRALRSERP